MEKEFLTALRFALLLLFGSLNFVATKPVFAQADFVTLSGWPGPSRVQPPPPTVNAGLTQSQGATAPDRGYRNLGPEFVCGDHIYRNNTGAVLAVTIQAPAFQYAIVYIKNNYMDAWRMGAYAVSSATSTVFVPVRGFYCPAGGGASASFFISVFRDNVSEELYLTRLTLWGQAQIGYCYTPYIGGGETTENMTPRSVFQRDYVEFSDLPRQPPVYVIPELGIITANNPTNQACP